MLMVDCTGLSDVEVAQFSRQIATIIPFLSGSLKEDRWPMVAVGRLLINLDSYSGYAVDGLVETCGAGKMRLETPEDFRFQAKACIFSLAADTTADGMVAFWISTHSKGKILKEARAKSEKRHKTQKALRASTIEISELDDDTMYLCVDVGRVEDQFGVVVSGKPSDYDIAGCSYIRFSNSTSVSNPSFFYNILALYRAKLEQKGTGDG